jgi:lysophospholipase L1-like esterase
VSRTVLRIGVVVAITVTLLSGWQLAGEGEEPAKDGPYPRGIVVVGDSITAMYNDEPGDRMQGWWSMVGRHFGAEVTTSAQIGSGYLREGLACSGNRFIDRPEAFMDVAPSLFIIEGGRNDWAICVDGRHVRSRSSDIAAVVDHYLDVVQANLPSSTHIVVMGPPWGTRKQDERRRITPIVRETAQAHGVQYIGTTGTIDRDSRLLDGVHPNRRGSTALADRVIAALE